MTLQNLQAELAEVILNDDLVTDLVSPIKNLAIYQNNTAKTLTHTLQSTYPLIEKLVGADFFKITAKEYIKCYPSCSGNLHDYGQYFSDFLAEYPPVKDLVYLSEVAQFEWMCHGLYFAADHAAFDKTKLENLTPEQYDQIHFSLHPASRLQQFYYPILQIIDLCKDNIEEIFDLEGDGVNLLMIRRDLDLSLIPLSDADFTFLQSVNDNYSLTEALDAALCIDANFRLEEKLPGWIEDKIIVDGYVNL